MKQPNANAIHFDYTAELAEVEKIITEAKKDAGLYGKFYIYERSKRKLEDLLLIEKDWLESIEKLLEASGIEEAHKF